MKNELSGQFFSRIVAAGSSLLRRQWVLDGLILAFMFFCLACSFPSFSADTPRSSFSFVEVKVPELVRVVYGELFREDYYFEQSFLQDQSEVSLDLRGVDPVTVREVVTRLVRSAGFVVEKQGHVWRFGKPNEVEAYELFFYRPKYRAISYLSDLLVALFPRGAFSFQRVNSGQSGQAATVPGVPANASPGQGAGSPASYSGSPGGQRSAPAVSAGSAPGQVAPDLDAFFFRGSLADVEKLQKLLAQVDVAPGELIVKAVIYEVRHSQADASALSIAASILGSRLGAQIAAPTLANSISVNIGGIQAVISALATDSRFKVVSSPSLRVQSGQNARFTVGDETPVLGAVTYQSNGQAVQNVDYRPSGVIFDLKPIVRDVAVDLTVFQQLSSFAVTATGVNNSPTLLKRELTTTLGVRAGETVLLGGLDDSRRSEDRSGLSFLPSWLTSRGSVEDRTEVLLVMDVQRL